MARNHPRPVRLGLEALEGRLAPDATPLPWATLALTPDGQPLTVATATTPDVTTLAVTTQDISAPALAQVPPATPGESAGLAVPLPAGGIQPTVSAAVPAYAIPAVGGQQVGGASLPTGGYTVGGEVLP